MKKRIAWGFFVTLLIVASFSILLIFWHPRDIIEYLGVNNSYMIMALVSVFGGASTITSTGWYATLTTLASGGLNPYYLGFVAGLFVSVGDSIFYLLGEQTRALEIKSLNKLVDKITRFLKNKPKWWASALTFVYAGFTPFPNDILMVSVGIIDIKYYRILPFLVLGNITLATIICLSVQFGIGL